MSGQGALGLTLGEPLIWLILALGVVSLIVMHGSVIYLHRNWMKQSRRAMRWRRFRKLADRIEELTATVERHAERVATLPAQSTRVVAHTDRLVVIRDYLTELEAECEELSSRSWTELVPRREQRKLYMKVNTLETETTALADEYTRLTSPST